MSLDSATAISPRRKRGKKSDPRYGPATLWLQKDVYVAVRRQLIGTESDVSELVTKLLCSWLEQQPAQRHQSRKQA